MPKYTVYDKNTGEIKFTFEGEEDVAKLNGEYISGIYSPEEYLIIDGTPQPKPPNISKEKERLLAEVRSQLLTRVYSPHNGFDADTLSRERISNTIARLQRGDGLPHGWVGWRDADNQMRWADSSAEEVLKNLTDLARAIEDREQALLITSWQHKANIEKLSTIEEILAYDVTKNWPS